MALEATFEDLHKQLKRLQDNLVALRLTVAEDKPLRGEAMLVDRLEDSINDTMGLIEECLDASRSAQKAVILPELDRARRALNKCQDRFHRAERQFSDELVSYEKLRDLASLATKRGREWMSWANSFKHGLEQCREPMDAANKALAACWQEIAEHAGTTSVSVRTTSIGQKIFTTPSELSELGRERIT